MVAKVMLGHQIGAALCEALQLPKLTRSFVLRAEVGSVVTVECEYYPEGDSLVAALAEYDLVPRSEQGSVEPTTPVHFDDWMRARIEKAHAGYMWRHAEGAVDYTIPPIERLCRGLPMGRP